MLALLVLAIVVPVVLGLAAKPSTRDRRVMPRR
jgi:hypothetical protein